MSKSFDRSALNLPEDDNGNAIDCTSSLDEVSNNDELDGYNGDDESDNEENEWKYENGWDIENQKPCKSFQNLDASGEDSKQPTDPYYDV